MGAFSISHLLIFLVVVVLIFGTKKLSNLGSDLGSAIKGFKNAMDDDKKKDEANQQQLPPGTDTNAVNSSAEKVDDKR
jgi:sec-independent protein translocase protein TatA